MKALLGGLVGAVALQRIVELRLAKRNEAWARERGAKEFGAGHYPLFFLLHGGWAIGLIAEAWLRGPNLSTWWWVWLGALIGAQGLRYWAIASLGPRWNTRILVLDLPPITSGPYRFLRHPNYLAVAIELASLPMIFGAWISAALASLANAILLLTIRIPAEERALGHDG